VLATELAGEEVAVLPRAPAVDGVATVAALARAIALAPVPLVDAAVVGATDAEASRARAFPGRGPA